MLALTLCLLAMHSLIGALPFSDTGEMNTAGPAVTSVTPDHAASLMSGRSGSGSGSMAVSTMEGCAAVVTAFGLSSVSEPLAVSALQLSGSAVRSHAVMSDPPGPPNPHAFGVLRI